MKKLKNQSKHFIHTHHKIIIYLFLSSSKRNLCLTIIMAEALSYSQTHLFDSCPISTVIINRDLTSLLQLWCSMIVSHTTTFVAPPRILLDPISLWPGRAPPRSAIMEVAPSPAALSRDWPSQTKRTSFDPPLSCSHLCRESTSSWPWIYFFADRQSPRLKPTTSPYPGRALSSKPLVSITPEQVRHRLQAQIPEMKGSINNNGWFLRISIFSPPTFLLF